MASGVVQPDVVLSDSALPLGRLAPKSWPTEQDGGVIR